MSFNFMAVVTICSDFGAPKIKSATGSKYIESVDKISEKFTGD